MGEVVGQQGLPAVSALGWAPSLLWSRVISYGTQLRAVMEVPRVPGGVE